MQTFPPTSQTFEQDQVWDYTITTWDTPFTPLEGGVASAGLPFTVVEPSDGTSATWKTFVDALKAAAINTDVSSTFTRSEVRACITDGRTDNVIGFWSAGAPGQHGATVPGKVAYHFRGALRAPAARAFFDSATTPTWFLALAGNGYMRVDKTVGGVVTTLFRGSVTERDFLINGFTCTAGITDMQAGDTLDIYYVQTGAETWGGFVVKAVPAALSSDAAANQTAAVAAPVLGCALVDTGTAPAAKTLHATTAVKVKSQRRSPMTAEFTAPLLNPAVMDGIGWEWTRSTAEDPGYLTLWDAGATVLTLRRKRLIQITEGFLGEQYPVFTGFVEDFAQPTGNTVVVTCRGFESRLLEQHDKNYPDQISYMASGFLRTNALNGTAEPIYGIPAYDNWPVEYALTDLFVRNGIDASKLRRTHTVPKADGTTATVMVNGTAIRKFRARTLNDKLLRLDRPVHYGNAGAGFTETLPADDAYLFKPDVTKEVWNRASELTERLGYELRFDALGDAVLQPRNNPTYAVDLTAADATGSPTTKTHPSAYAAQYLEWTGSTAGITTTVVGARIDLSLPLDTALGAWTFTVTNSASTVVASGTLTPEPTDVPLFFYDGALNADATNATVVTLHSGEYDTYTVTLAASGGAATRRVDCLFVYHTDPMLPRYPQTFSTAANALKVQAQSAMDDMRNAVIVVGARKAAVTDSTKFQSNPNNPEAEFIVERAVDLGSIADTSAPNFVGAVKESIIYDSSITDNAYARYLAQAFIYRYRNPKPPVQVSHTLVPMVDLNDPIYAEEKTTASVGIDGTDPRSSVLWVTGYEHLIDGMRATTELTTSSFPDFPAFEPREDIDLALFNGKPVVNVGITYTALDGTTQTNVGQGAAYLCAERASVGGVGGLGEWVTVSGVVPSGNTLTLPHDALTSWPPVPGTVFVKPRFANPGYDQATDYTLTPPQTETVRRGQSLLSLRLPNQIGIVSVSVDTSLPNAPAGFGSLGSRTAGTDRTTSEFYYTVTDEDIVTITGGDLLKDTRSVRGTVVWKLGNKDTRLGWVTNNPYHHFFNVDYRLTSRQLQLVWNHGDNTSAMYTRAAADSYDIKYRRLGPCDSSGAFTTPYTTGTPFYDPYTSELGYTVGISADVLVSGLYRVSVRNVDDDTVVAWLTEPTADPQQPESHWQFLPAAAGKTFAWDGVDNLGIWNRKQSVRYAASASGVFQEGTRDIGAGFYVWNQEDGPLALISGDCDATTGRPVFGHGPFARWYIYIECKTDTTTTVVRSDTLDAAHNPAASALVYTHLPAPTAVELSVADWASSTDYNANDLDAASPASAFNPANWGVLETTRTINPDATINNQKPVRMRFRVLPRPGVLWTNFQGETTVKLTRHVHLRTNIHDQFVVYNGSNWPGSSFEDTAIYSRRLTNDEHTLTYGDDAYRKASSLKWSDTDQGTEWVFTPALFKKNFRGYEEAIQFGDYLQLEEVPKWDLGQRQAVAGARARLQLAFMNYLFYLSGYVSDRSGRSVWAMNRSFLDQSKICNNTYGDWWDPTAPTVAATSATYATELPDDLAMQHRRTLVTRQWTDEKVNGVLWTTTQKTRFKIPSGSIGEALLRHKWGEHSPNATTIAGMSWSSFTTLALDDYTQWHCTRSTSGTTATPTILDTAYKNLTRQLTSLGAGCTWTWETQPTWTPCITRDFHGYRLLPPMVDDPGVRGGHHNYQGGVYQYVDMRTFVNTAKTPNTGEDAAAGETWSSPVYDMTEPYDASDNGRVRFWPGTQVSLTEEPTKSKGVTANTVNYVRQDELVHWEDLRGMYSRGRRPAEPPIKVAPVQPYYQNLYTYATLVRWFNKNAATFPYWQAPIGDWFRMTFRSEYYWESGTLFPVTEHGVERLEWMNAWRTRFLPTTATNTVRYDDGAWVGWKDDRPIAGTDTFTHNKVGQVSIGFYTGAATDGRIVTPFEGDAQVAAVGPILPQTTDMIFHLVLVPERRNSSV